MVADLGCGDGRLLRHVARKGTRTIGFDVNPYCIARAREAAELAGLANLIEVLDHDMFKLDGNPQFEACSVIYAYLMPPVIKRLEPLLRKAVEAGDFPVSQ